MNEQGARKPSDEEKAAATKLARDIGLPQDAVLDIFSRVNADLHRSSEPKAWPILCRANQELLKLGETQPAASGSEDALIDQFLKRLPSSDYQILCHFKCGRKHREIAKLMGTDLHSVRRSLVKTYVYLSLIGSTDPDGGGEPAQVASS